MIFVMRFFDACRSRQGKLTPFMEYFSTLGQSPQILHASVAEQCFSSRTMLQCLANTELPYLGYHWMLISKGSIPEVSTVFHRGSDNKYFWLCVTTKLCPCISKAAIVNIANAWVWHCSDTFCLQEQVGALVCWPLLNFFFKFTLQDHFILGMISRIGYI